MPLQHVVKSRYRCQIKCVSTHSIFKCLPSHDNILIVDKAIIVHVMFSLSLKQVNKSANEEQKLLLPPKGIREGNGTEVRFMTLVEISIHWLRSCILSRPFSLMDKKIWTFSLWICHLMRIQVVFSADTQETPTARTKVPLLLKDDSGISISGPSEEWFIKIGFENISRLKHTSIYVHENG